TISLEGAVNEVAKYIMKPDGWLKVSDEQLAEVAAVEKWPRMFELLGACREKREPREPVIGETGDVCDRAISIEERILALREAGEIVAASDGRRWIHNDFELARQACAELYVLCELLPETLAALKARTAY